MPSNSTLVFAAFSSGFAADQGPSLMTKTPSRPSRTLRLATVSFVATCLVIPPLVEAQDRWYAVYQDGLGSITVDTTRIVRLNADLFRVWTRNSSNSLSLQEWDCRALRSRVLQYESGDPSRPLARNSDTTFLDMAPESRGEAYLKAGCTFLREHARHPVSKPDS